MKSEHASGDIYDWLIHLVEKSWLTEADIYALNTAFLFGMEYLYPNAGSIVSFTKTFLLQQDRLKRNLSICRKNINTQFVY